MALKKPIVAAIHKNKMAGRPFHLVPQSEFAENDGIHAQTEFLQEGLRLNKDLSMSRRQDRIRTAVLAVFNQMTMKECGGEVASSSYAPSPWVSDYFDDHVVVQRGADLYAVPYTENGTTVKAGKPKKIRDAYVEED